MPTKIKKFELTGRMVFLADSIDDAFAKLSEHFEDIIEDGEGIELLPGTDVNIQAVDGTWNIKGKEIEKCPKK